VVPDLEQVDPRQQPARRQRRLHRCLGIAGEERGKAAVAEHEDDRAIVDVTLGEGSMGVLSRRIEHLERSGTVEHERLAGDDAADGEPCPGRIGQEAVIGGVLEMDSSVDEEADIEPIEHVHEAGDVVLVRMAENQQVDASREEGHVRPETSQRQLGVRTAVDQGGRSVGRLDQDGVTLSDVEDGDVKEPVRP
jgi:hypothetical protein